MRKKIPEGYESAKALIRKETADDIRSGDYVSKNGIRKAKGPASLHPHQPEIILEDEPKFSEICIEAAKEGASAAVGDWVNNKCTEAANWLFSPASIDWFNNNVIPFAKRCYHKTQSFLKKKRSALDENANTKYSASENQLINFSDYVKEKNEKGDNNNAEEQSGSNLRAQ